MRKVWGWIKFVVVVMILVFGALFAVSALPIADNYKVYTVLSGSMEPAIKTGSIVIVKPQADYVENDVITVKGKNASQPVTHRIVEIAQNDDKVEFVTKGDANEDADTEPRAKGDVIGKVLFSIPLIGYPMKFAQTQIGFMVMIVIPGVLIVYHEILTIAAEIRKKWNLRKKKDDEGEGKIGG